MEISSSSRTAGSTLNVRAMASICCSPPESVPATWCDARPGGGSGRRPSPPRATADGPPKVIRRRFSVTVRLGKMPRPSGNVHRPARASLSGRMPLTWRPITWKQPFVGSICPLATLSVVDLPAPLGPSRASTCAGGDGQVDAVQDLDLPVGGMDAAQLDDGTAAARPQPWARRRRARAASPASTSPRSSGSSADPR